MFKSEVIVRQKKIFVGPAELLGIFCGNVDLRPPVWRWTIPTVHRVSWDAKRWNLHVAGDVIQVGNDIKASANNFNSAGRSFLLQHAIPVDGIVVAWTSYYHNRRPAEYHVWRPVGGANNTQFHLVKEVVIMPTMGLAEETVSITRRMFWISEMFKGL